jgi:hypothetical protein
MKNKIFNIVISVIGLLIALSTMILLLMNDFLPVSIIKALPIFIFILIELMLLITAIQMLFAKLIIAKLAAIPMILVMFLVAFFLINMPIYQLLMSSLIGVAYEVDINQMFDTMSTGFKYFHIGIWVSVTPIFIAGLWTMKQTTQKIPKNIDDYYPTTAKVLSCGFTDVIINNIPVYRLELEVVHYEGIYTVTKDIRIRSYSLLAFTQNSYVNVLIDPDKKSRLFIKTEDTIY